MTLTLTVSIIKYIYYNVYTHALILGCGIQECGFVVMNCLYVCVIWCVEIEIFLLMFYLRKPENLPLNFFFLKQYFIYAFPKYRYKRWMIVGKCRFLLYFLHLRCACIFIFSLYEILGCFSGLQDQICKEQNNGTMSDMIYWHRQCTRISDICEENNMLSYDDKFCQNPTTGELKAIRRIITRVLASEEYY